MPKTVETRVGVCYNDFKYCTKGETGMLISLVVPCYNEEESLPIFYKEASKIAQQMGISHGADFEFIFVDDGSKDHTLQIARELHRKDARVRYISFSRNFGKEAGIYAGLKAAKGDYVATMDADLQDPPSLLPEMLELLLSGECPVEFSSLGRWWGNNPKEKRQTEIDILAEQDKNTALFGECKWTNEKVDLGILETLVKRSRLFPYQNVHYYLFSKTGFTKGCADRANEMGNVTLVRYEDITSKM